MHQRPCRDNQYPVYRFLPAMGWRWLIVGLICAITGCQPTDRNAATPTSSSAREPMVTIGEPVLHSVIQGLLESDVRFFCPQVEAGKAIDRDQIRKIQQSQLVVLDGLHGSNQWSQQVSIPQSRTIHSTFEVLDELIYVPKLSSHTHGPGQAHSHGGILPQTWTDPKLFGKQVNYVLDELVNKQLINESQRSAALQKWNQIREPLNVQFEKAASDKPVPVLVDQPGLEYLCRRLNWKPTQWELSGSSSDESVGWKGQIQTWLAANPGGRVVLLNEPSPPLAAALLELKVDYLQLDLAPARFYYEYYGDTVADLLRQIQP